MVGKRPARADVLERVQGAGASSTWALAVAFGLASVPWTYAFVAGLGIPLWPSFVASATYFAADADGVRGAKRAAASILAGVSYAALTIVVVNAALGGGAVALSLVVGVFMFLATLHAFVPALSFTPGAFFGYATLFGVSAADPSAFGIAGVGGTALAAGVAMLIGVGIGVTVDAASERYT